TFFCISDTLVPTTYLVDTTLSNSSDSDQTVQAVRLQMNEVYCLRSPSLANHVLSCIPASPVQLTFSIADNPPEICSLVVFVSSPKIK
ncbi:hypothetical protein, partial [Escherichia coli]|uniref:hypothetical protein n=2 Tax=Enterobacterales TaxID=91347 RepID=UPI001BC8B045